MSKAKRNSNVTATDEDFNQDPGTEDFNQDVESTAVTVPVVARKKAAKKKAKTTTKIPEVTDVPEVIDDKAKEREELEAKFFPYDPSSWKKNSKSLSAQGICGVCKEKAASSQRMITPIVKQAYCEDCKSATVERMLEGGKQIAHARKDPGTKKQAKDRISKLKTQQDRLDKQENDIQEKKRDISVEIDRLEKLSETLPEDAPKSATAKKSPNARRIQEERQFLNENASIDTVKALSKDFLVDPSLINGDKAAGIELILEAKWADSYVSPNPTS